MLETKEEIIEWLDKMQIENYRVNEDLTVDVDGYVSFSKQIREFPVQFGVVEGDFDCSYGSLHSLVGSPKIVHGNFNCSHNHLNTLEGAPEFVSGDLDCSSNNLYNFEYIPTKILGEWKFNNNDIDSFDGLAEIITSNLYLENNRIKTLEGFPSHSTGDVVLTDNPLKSFEHVPLKIEGEFKHDGIAEQGIKPNASIEEINRINDVIKAKESLEKELNDRNSLKKPRMKI